MPRPLVTKLRVDMGDVTTTMGSEEKPVSTICTSAGASWSAHVASIITSVTVDIR